MTWYKTKSYTKAKTSIYKGVYYDSMFECSYAMALDDRLNKGEIKSWDRQETIDLIVNGYKIGSYKMDFTIYHHDGLKEWVETKGFATPIWSLRWKILCAMYEDNPNIKLTLVTQGKSGTKMRKIKKI